jgi:hypothetical protein
VWRREVVHGVVNPPRIDGKDGVAGSIPAGGSTKWTLLLGPVVILEVDVQARRRGRLLVVLLAGLYFPRVMSASASTSAVDLDDGIGERLGCLLRQVVTDALDDPVPTPAENFSVCRAVRGEPLGRSAERGYVQVF